MKCAIVRFLVISSLIVLFISGCSFFASDNANQTAIAKTQIAQITNTRVNTDHQFQLTRWLLALL